ncbi:MAG: response regulator [Alphaproteobacteria bacterium]|nr:response regulator [Alphaproteobacteria bacterium]
MGKALILDQVDIILADDNEHMRSLVRAMLMAFGCKKIREARDGAEVLELMQERVCDILVTDWVMSPLDGVELTRMLRNSGDSPNPFVPIIMISAFAERRKVFQARDSGINEFLVKPLSAKALYSRLVAVIDKPRNFVRTKRFFGPDRRRRKDEFMGDDKRGKTQGADQPAMDTPMSQAEINSLFNPK